MLFAGRRQLTYIAIGMLFNEAVEWIHDLLKLQGDRVGP